MKFEMLKQYFDTGQLRRTEPSSELAAKEFKEAAYDMAGARKALAEKDYK
ncbi:TPA: hypothetical protein HA316_02085 [Candidatus Micrarchaeota archaeon]|nr:hypothetical protein [Candidatus Micrarchaeota archaeon]